MSATADYIREAREERGLTLGQAAEATGIPRYYLEILEGGGNDRLVSDRLYMVHFLRTYAAYLDIEVEALAAQFVRENRALPSAPAPPQKAGLSRTTVAAASLFCLLLIVAGVYVYDPVPVQQADVAGTPAEPPEAETPPADTLPATAAAPPALPAAATPTPPSSTEQSSVLQPEADETAPADPRRAEGQPAATSPGASEAPAGSVEVARNTTESGPAQARPETPTEAAAAPGGDQTTADGTAAANQTAAASETRESAGPARTDSAEAAATHTLTIVAEARSWLRIWVDDKPSRDFLLNPGQSATLSADTGFNITFGNAGGVRLTLNDQELPAVGRAGQVIRNYRLPRPQRATP